MVKSKKSLTAQERLEVLALRHPKGRKGLAGDFGITEDQLSNMITGRTFIPTMIVVKLFDSPALTDGEKCYFMRKRLKLRQSDVARRIGCSRYWLLLMERGDVPVSDDLFDYLRAQF